MWRAGSEVTAAAIGPTLTRWLRGADRKIENQDRRPPVPLSVSARRGGSGAEGVARLTGKSNIHSDELSTAEPVVEAHCQWQALASMA